MKKYDHKKIEKKWQEVWEKTDLYHALDEVGGKKNLYHLVMFPYPSGDLHLGHWYNYAGADFRARYMRMKGYNVMSPIGFDAFGLPAENAAIKNKTHPKDWTYANIDRMRTQLSSIGTVFDWSREVVTCDPDYYKWTQWMFLFMYKNGLAYKAKKVSNWCPSCNTVIANEQVVGEGVCERCESAVEQRELDQWMFKITKYADELIDDLDKIDWPEKTKTMQRNWVGRSEGAEVEFRVSDFDFRIKVFTTRPDTLFGATFMVLAPEHPFVLEAIKEARSKKQEVRAKKIEKYVDVTKKKTELQRMEDEGKEKTGVFTGVYAINPVNGMEIPIWIADYVLMGYGHGAIMAVPAHDERDWDFAKKFDLPIIEVLEGGNVQKEPYVKDGKHVNSEYLDGLNKEEAIKKVIEVLGKDGLAKKSINYRLRDWIISRQRYWGAPIPIIYCRSCWEKANSKIETSNKSQEPNKEILNYTIIDGTEHLIVPVLEEDLPVKLPEDVDLKPTGESPLVTSNSFVNTKCPKCGGHAKRETDTMDTFLCSSWYYFRYLDNKNEQEFTSKSKIKKWMPVDMYIGGAEHSVLHLLYSRFFTKALRDHSDFVDFDEPFATLRHQGTILGEDGQKMSKSIGNVVSPDKEVNRVGSDAVRMFIGFMGPFDQGGPWNPNGVTGVKRFLDKVWSLANKDLQDGEMNAFESRLVNKSLKKVGEDIDNFKFNTAIASLMTLVNELSSQKEISRQSVEYLLIMLAPFAPHLTEEIWEKFGNVESIHIQPWPNYDSSLIVDEVATIVVQVNGKVRANLEMSKNSTQDSVEKTALTNENVKKFIGDKKPKKVIYVQDKILNIVV